MTYIDSLVRLKVSRKLDSVDLYVPEPVWKELTKRLDGNKLTVALRFEGEDGTTILGKEAET